MVLIIGWCIFSPEPNFYIVTPQMAWRRRLSATLLLLLLLAFTGIATAMTPCLACAATPRRSEQWRTRQPNPPRRSSSQPGGDCHRHRRRTHRTVSTGRFPELSGYAADELRTIDDWCRAPIRSGLLGPGGTADDAEMVTTACETGTCAGLRELHIACKDGMDMTSSFTRCGASFGDLGSGP